MFLLCPSRPRLQTLTLVLTLALLLAGCQKHLPPPTSPPPPQSPAQRLQDLRKSIAAGQCAQTLPALEALVRQTPDSAEAFLLLGLCNAKQNNPDQAEIALSRAVTLAPNNPQPLEALAILRYDRKQYPAAKDALNRATSLGSTNPQTYYYLGNLEMQAGNCSAALANYRKAMAKDPGYQAAFTEYRAAAAACAQPGMSNGNGESREKKN